jgi:hypothetical protein
VRAIRCARAIRTILAVSLCGGRGARVDARVARGRRRSAGGNVAAQHALDANTAWSKVLCKQCSGRNDAVLPLVLNTTTVLMATTLSWIGKARLSKDLSWHHFVSLLPWLEG